MKLFYRNLPFAFSSILFGTANLLIHFGLIEIERSYLISFVLVYSGLYLIYKEIEGERRNLIVIGVLSFFSGIAIFIFNHYNILFFYKPIFSVLLFILAMIYFFLFVNSSRNKIFLHLSIVFILIAFCSIFLVKLIPFHERIISINKSISHNWYIFRNNWFRINCKKKRCLVGFSHHKYSAFSVFTTSAFLNCDT